MFSSYKYVYRSPDHGFKSACINGANQRIYADFEHVVNIMQLKKLANSAVLNLESRNLKLCINKILIQRQYPAASVFASTLRHRIDKELKEGVKVYKYSSNDIIYPLSHWIYVQVQHKSMHRHMDEKLKQPIGIGSSNVTTMLYNVRTGTDTHKKQYTTTVIPLLWYYYYTTLVSYLQIFFDFSH